ncbi:hypothetical protein [Shimia sp. SDUM112013]|uniref:hypothetical protein n=1 Tax=Shimia sp. SDUM112013 TaxID=3136160 RepID=UPI0032ED73D2
MTEQPRKTLRPPDGWRGVVARWLVRIRKRIPPGWRWPVGLVIMLFGFVGFLPVVGFWMIPLGIAVMALDLSPRWRNRKRK